MRRVRDSGEVSDSADILHDAPAAPLLDEATPLHCACCNRLRDLVDEWDAGGEWVAADSWEHGYGDAMYSVQYVVYGCQERRHAGSINWRCEYLEGHDGPHYAHAPGTWTSS